MTGDTELFNVVVTPIDPDQVYTYGPRLDNMAPDVEIPDAAEIPTVSEWGLIVLTLLGMTAGTIILARRRRPATAAD